MRLPTSSCLLCRHSVLFRPSNTPRLSILPVRPASSLSAIHHGLRQSQKSRPQGFRQSSLETARPRRPSDSPRQRRDPDWTPPNFKLKKGKKDITDTGPGRQSRRSRFNDPEQSFGKRSMVYQMKHGALREKVAELRGRARGSVTPPARRAPADRLSSADFMKDFEASSGRPMKPTRDGRTGRGALLPDRRPADRTFRTGSIAETARNFDNERTRHAPIPSRENRGESSFRSSSFGNRHEPSDRPKRLNRSWNQDGQDVGRERHEPSNKPDQLNAFGNQDKQDVRREQEGRKEDDSPIRIHHTTAASQFLYGRSVVAAALKDSRRQLYQLYIYNGDDRRNVSQDDGLERLARQKGLRVTKVPNNGLRMLDKMSGGRPHNGCVLEASPLPQLPLKALGPLSEDPKEPGFHVEMAHQSSEEAKVNGTSDLIRYQLPKERNPFVLLLDGILDPGNLGAILRTAAFLGVNGIAITKSSSATLTPAALKASAGASEVTTLFSVHSAVDFLARSKENGWLVYAAVPSTKRARGNSHLTVDRVETYDPLSSQPTVLVIGSEGEGITKPVRRQADHEVSIPSPSGGFLRVVDSLNVSVATGILCSAFLKNQSSGLIEIEEPFGSEKADESQLW